MVQNYICYMISDTLKSVNKKTRRKYINLCYLGILDYRLFRGGNKNNAKKLSCFWQHFI